jgi:catechol 2,3-dioxygenase-like lactoylglutathione lyase family enzyme
VDMKLEVVMVPVSDVDRAKRFYQTLGFRLDIDYIAGENFRVAQLTPPGSECSIIIGKGSTSAVPGSVSGSAPHRSRHRSVPRRTRRPGRRRGGGIPRRGVCSTTPGPRDGQAARRRGVATMARLPPSVIPTATVGCSK